MDKLLRIAGLVDKVRALCEEHNLEEKDVPLGLRTTFESLKTYGKFHFCPLLFFFRWLIMYFFCIKTKK
jgi:hypothetical protein